MPVPKVLINSIPNVSAMRKNVYLLTNQDATHFLIINPALIMTEDELIRNKKPGLTKNIGKYLKLGGLIPFHYLFVNMYRAVCKEAQRDE